MTNVISLYEKYKQQKKGERAFKGVPFLQKQQILETFRMYSKINAPL